MRVVILNAFVAASLLAGQGLDRPRYGTVLDLRGLTRVFIDTGTDVKARNLIVRELCVSGAAFDVVQDSRDAEILLEFGASVERRVGGWVTETRDKDKKRQESVTTTTEQTIQRGTGTVFVVRDGALLVVESFADEKRIFFERDPAINFCRTFLRSYRRANALPNKP
jgi:hypothetical protein